MVHLLKIVVPAVALLVLAAPWVLRIFGPSYAAAGTSALRLLGLSALPFIVTGMALAVLVGHGRLPAHGETWLEAGSGCPRGAPRPASGRGAVSGASTDPAVGTFEGRGR